MLTSSQMFLFCTRISTVTMINFGARISTVTMINFGDKVTPWYLIKIILNYIENRIIHIYRN